MGTPVRADDLGGHIGGVDGHKRADYILERGMWRAVCRACRYSVQNPDRQRASILFRGHYRAVLAAAPTAEIVDLRTDSPLTSAADVITLGQEQNSA